MRVKLYARVLVGEWFFGRRVNQHAPRFFTYDAVTQRLAADNNNA